MNKPDDHPMWLAEFGCFTGDCPHESWEQCLDAIGKDWLSQRAEIRTLTAENEAMPGWKAANRRLADDLLEKEAKIAAITEQLEQAEQELVRIVYELQVTLGRLEQHQWHREKGSLPNSNDGEFEIARHDPGGWIYDVIDADDFEEFVCSWAFTHYRKRTPPEQVS